ncbi:hypothetical protein ACTWKB_21190 [Bacillus sp. 4A_MP2]
MDSVKKEEIIKSLKEVDNFEIIDTSELPKNTPMIEFDSVEDFKKMLDGVTNDDDLLDDEVAEDLELKDHFSLSDQKISTMAVKKSLRLRVDHMKLNGKNSIGILQVLDMIVSYGFI